MKVPRKEPAPAATDKYTVVFSPLPMNYVRTSGLRVRANRTVKGIKKGQEYQLRLITDKGMIQLVGDIDNLYPMGAFNPPIAALADLSIAVEEAANDNASK